MINGLAFVIGSVLVLLILFRWFKPWEGGSGAKDTRRAFGWAALTVFGIYAGLGIIRCGTGGLLSFIRGKDVTVPTHLAAGTLDLSIRAAGGLTWSDPVPFKVLPKSRIRRRS